MKVARGAKGRRITFCCAPDGTIEQAGHIAAQFGKSSALRKRVFSPWRLVNRVRLNESAPTEANASGVSENCLMFLGNASALHCAPRVSSVVFLVCLL